MNKPGVLSYSTLLIMCVTKPCASFLSLYLGDTAQGITTHSHLSGAHYLVCSDPYISARAGFALRLLSCSGCLRTTF